MKYPPNVIVNLDGNKQYDAHFEEIVYPDRTYGQYESGAVYWIPQTDQTIFINEAGTIYKWHTDQVIGVCNSVKEVYDSYAGEV